jgi:hypothetical protein
MGSSKKQTIGYRYYMSILSGLCRGPVDEFVGWEAADKDVFTGQIVDPITFGYINKPDLFGGEKKEGGIQGPFAVWMGEPNQVLPGGQNYGGVGSSGGKNGIFRALLGGTREFFLPSVKESIATGTVSEFRGVVTLWFNGLVSCMNPYIKEWSFRVRRYRKGWYGGVPWYPEKALISLENGAIRSMNGAHIIYEACTNPQWGRGLPANRLDESSFIYAANQLCNEAFGLCLAWYRKEDIDVFIQKICDLIGAVLYTDRETGLIVLRLVRDDYFVDDLPLFTPDTGLLDIIDDDSATADSSFNEVIGTGRDPVTNQDFQMRAQNIAAFQSQQAVASLDQDYRGIPTKTLLSRVVLRDLRANAGGLKKYTVVLDRRGWRVAPGMPFRISDPKRGINNVVLRSGEIDDGNMLNGQISIKAIQDVFGLPSTSYVTPAPGGWFPPPSEPVPSPDQRLIEAGYRDIYRIMGAGDAAAAPLDAAYMGQLAAAPNMTSYQYDLATKADGEAEFVVRATGSFTGYARLDTDITATQTVFDVVDPNALESGAIGDAMLIGNELVEIVDFDDETLTATVKRGVADTLPAEHAAGTRMWTYDDDLVNDTIAYTTGETVQSKVLTRISSGVLDMADADPNTLELVGRQARPYPPADVRVNGISIYGVTGENSEPVITWASRNRITQADHLVGYFESSVLGETGQTYTIRVYDPADDTTPLRTVEGITDLTWTYDGTMQAEDNPPSTVRMEIVSVRDELESWQVASFRVILRSGWGYGWGLNWGGA